MSNFTHKLEAFDFFSNNIRTIAIDGEPWFAVKDICDVLAIRNTAHFVASLLSTDVIHILKSNIGQTKVSFPNRGLTFISAPALYRAVLRSDKKEATQFQDWVTRTVLPAIRNDGIYVLGEEKVATGEMSLDEMELLVFERLRQKAARLTAVTDNHIKSVCIKTYCGLRREYLSQSDTMKVVSRAKKIMVVAGMPIPKITMKVGGKFHSDGSQVYGASNFYDFASLHDAAEELNVFEAVMDTNIVEHFGN